MKIVLPIVVGAVIGLFTNWLAIIMLFRPWQEKRLFGMRLPLTPGLIPRRQNDLADKLGQIVDEELLTPEGMARSISRPELEYAVKRAAVRSIGETLNAAPTLGLLVARLFGEAAMDKAQSFVVHRTMDYLRSDEAERQLTRIADSLFDHLRGSLREEHVRRELARAFAAPLHQNLANSTLIWKDALPEGARSLIEERLMQQIDPLLEGASRWLTEPDVVAAISRMLQEKVENIPLIGPMAKGFLTLDRVQDDIVPRLQSVIESRTTRDLIEGKAAEFLRGFWERPVGRIVGRLSEQDLTDLLDKTLRAMFDRAFAEGTASRQMFRDLIVRSLQAGASETTLGDLAGRLVEALEAWNLRDLYISRTDDVDRLITRIWRWLRGHLIDALPDVLDALHLRAVVREQVASYPIATLEKLIRSVVNQELRMITLLGGLLGAVIGLIQALILL
ncbi:DUF445 family protein [Tumebacillus sp. DT12]|uniref:DUF445 family protein n=1 Tax=Tumebacillus lacus TaxID=2995335 RepID=A0ABT3X160_9BACL|nr:DUF445 family protein [Tumebacillus lacus]MCX7570662.1 DUF445 family protein [Tumebacillus lacus]